MTRIEKYAAYRQEIVNSQKLSIIFKETNDDVEYFKKAISKVSPNILANIKPVEVELIKMVNINNSSLAKVPNELFDIINYINNYKLDSVATTIDDLFRTLKGDSILTEDDEFDQEWLLSSPNYRHFYDVVGTNFLNEQHHNTEKFSTELEQKYNISLDKQIFDIKEIAQVETKKTKDIGLKILKISLIIMALFFVIAILLIVFGILRI